jgi:hypothetical protein
MPTELQLAAREAFTRARRFYKGGIKGANKQYDLTLPLPQYSQAQLQRARHRNANAELFLRFYHGGHLIRGLGFTFLGAGNALRAAGDSRGQCGEMSCLAISCFYEQMRHAPANFVAIGYPGDHAFVLVGMRPRVFKSVADLAKVSPSDDSWAIDVWANVFCHSSQYANRFRDKMVKWDDDGKEVNMHGRWRSPAGTYIDINMTAPVTYFDPRNPRYAM